MIEYPEALSGMKEDGDGFAFGRRDLIGTAFEIESVVVVDAARAAQ